MLKSPYFFDAYTPHKSEVYTWKKHALIRKRLRLEKYSKVIYLQAYPLNVNYSEIRLFSHLSFASTLCFATRELRKHKESNLKMIKKSIFDGFSIIISSHVKLRKRKNLLNVEQILKHKIKKLKVRQLLENLCWPFSQSNNFDLKNTRFDPFLAYFIHKR